MVEFEQPMETMLQINRTATYSETANAVSAPCRRTPVADGSLLRWLTTLAERSVR
jgi:hypothetical protein